MEKAKLSCKLASPELQERKRTVVAELKKLLLERHEIENGFRYKFEGTDKLIDLLTSFIKTERLCCEFFEFGLTVAGDGGHNWLQLSGPEGTKRFIMAELEF
jgi:hypothetical protein